MINYLKATYLILKYGAADLDFSSYSQFGRYSRFMKKYFKWEFKVTDLYEWDNVYVYDFLFTGAKNKELLKKYEDYR